MMTVPLVILFITSGAAHGATLTLVDRGTNVAEIPVEQLSTAIPLTRLKVWEPHENRDVFYEGYLLTDVLNSYYGDRWKKADLINFVCSDGYKSPVPRSNI